MRLNDHNCERCDALFIVFKEDIACPNCNFQKKHIGHDHLDFIPFTVEKMMDQKSKHGRYDGPGWKNGTLSDEVGRTCASIFETFEHSQIYNPYLFFNNILNEMSWHDNVYLKIHIRDLLVTMYPYYKKHSWWRRFVRNIISILQLRNLTWKKL